MTRSRIIWTVALAVWVVVGAIMGALLVDGDGSSVMWGILAYLLIMQCWDRTKNIGCDEEAN